MCDCINKKYTTSVISRKEFQEALCCMLNQITEADTNSTYTFVGTDTIDYTTVLDSVTNNTVVSSRRRQTVLPLSNLTSTAVIRSSDITDDGKVVVLNSGTDVSSEYLYTLPEIDQPMIDDGWFVDVVIESGNKVTIKTEGTDIFRNHTQLSADDTATSSNLPFTDIQSIRQFRFVAVKIDNVRQWIEVKKEIPQEVDFSILVENTLFVMENGDDTTALPNRLDLPYASVRTAMGAANPGDTVIVYPGVYNYTYTHVQLNTDEIGLDVNDLALLVASYQDQVQISNYYILKPDVNLHMYKGAVINITGLNDTQPEYTYAGGTAIPEFPIKFGDTKHGITGNGEIHFDLQGQLASTVYMYIHKSASSVMELDYFSIKSNTSKTIAIALLDNAALATHNFNFKFLEFEEVSWAIVENLQSVSINYNIEDLKFTNTTHDNDVFVIIASKDNDKFSNITFKINNIVGSHSTGNSSVFDISQTKANVTVDIKNLDLKEVNNIFRILTLNEVVSNLNFQVHNFRTSGRLLDHNNTSLIGTPDNNTTAYIKLHGVILNTVDEIIYSSINISTLNSETLTLDLNVVDRRSIIDHTDFVNTNSSGFVLMDVSTDEDVNVTITGKYTYSPETSMDFGSVPFPSGWNHGIIGKDIDSEGALLRNFNVVYKGLETTPAITDFPSLVYTSTPGLSPIDYDLINVFSNTNDDGVASYNVNLDYLRTDLKVK